MQSQFRNSIAFQWDHSKSQLESVPSSSLSWSVSDAGTLYGAILVERFRSYGLKFLDLVHHQSRLTAGALQLGIDLSALSLDLISSAEALLEHNRELVAQQGDVSVVVLLSPGQLSEDAALGTKPTLMMHLSPLPFTKLDRWYQTGVDLILSSRQVVPNACWPNQIKCRSRLPYFLSDAIASHANSHALSLLRTANGFVADTSVANLLFVDSRGDLVSPRKEDILVGCTLRTMEQLLQKQNLEIQFRDVSDWMLLEAREILLTGSSGGIWFASSFQGMSLPTPLAGSMTFRLTNLWKRHVEFDFVAQAASRRLL